MINLITLFYC